MLKKIVGLYTKCLMKRRAKEIGDKLTESHKEWEFQQLEIDSPKFRHACRNMIRLLRITHGTLPFKRSEVINGGIVETKFILTSFGNIKE